MQIQEEVAKAGGLDAILPGVSTVPCTRHEYFDRYFSNRAPHKEGTGWAELRRYCDAGMCGSKCEEESLGLMNPIVNSFQCTADPTGALKCFCQKTGFTILTSTYNWTYLGV